MFPTPDVFRARKLICCLDRIAFPNSDRVMLVTGPPALFFYLDRDLQLIEIRVSDGLKALHAELFHDHVLDHPLSPEEIRSWKQVLYFDVAPTETTPRSRSFSNAELKGIWRESHRQPSKTLLQEATEPLPVSKNSIPNPIWTKSKPNKALLQKRYPLTTEHTDDTEGKSGRFPNPGP
ncbi:MAG: hypothetical protein ACE5JX_06650 [Acidobacteriota bacterium]